MLATKKMFKIDNQTFRCPIVCDGVSGLPLAFNLGGNENPRVCFEFLIGLIAVRTVCFHFKVSPVQLQSGMGSFFASQARTICLHSR